MEFVLKSSFALTQISLSTVVLSQKLLLCFHELLGFLKSWQSLFCMVDDYHLRFICRFAGYNNDAGAIFRDALRVVTYFPPNLADFMPNLCVHLDRSVYVR